VNKNRIEKRWPGLNMEEEKAVGEGN